MSEVKTSIQLSINYCSTAVSESDYFGGVSFVGTCLLDIPGYDVIGINYKANIKSGVEDGYKDFYYDAMPLKKAALSSLCIDLQDAKTLNIFNTRNIYVTEPAKIYSDKDASYLTVDINTALLESIRSQSGSYYTARKYCQKAKTRLLEISEMGAAKNYLSEWRRILQFLKLCQRARGWDNTVCNSNYIETKLYKVERAFEDLAKRSQTTHKNYISAQRSIRTNLSSFHAPESWVTEPPRVKNVKMSLPSESGGLITKPICRSTISTFH